MSEWYDDRRNLAAVARYMGERGDSVDDVAYMLEKPEKYADDWRATSHPNMAAVEQHFNWRQRVNHGAPLPLDLGQRNAPLWPHASLLHDLRRPPDER